MKKEVYDKLLKDKNFEVLWFELLNASGFAGVLPEGGIVDKRYFPEALDVPKNTLFGVATPKEIVRLEFKGIDDFNRPVFTRLNTTKPQYYGSVTKLYSNEMTNTYTVTDYFNKHPHLLEYFGTKFNCEPNGGLSPNIVFEFYHKGNKID